jgi:hypothetical protein
VKRSPGIVVVGAVLAAVACTRIPPAEPLPPARLDRAIRALERGDHATAVADLLVVAGRCPVTPLARQALLLAAGAAIDPRNPARQLDLGAVLAARYLAIVPADESGARPLAQTLYLLALELGATAPAAIGCGVSMSAVAKGTMLPQADSPTVPARIGALERELERLRDELVRIRKALEPSQ